MKNYIKNKWKYTIIPYVLGIINIPYATYLCIRFPFLYPRNRFTGYHYNNWTINEKLKDLYNKAYKTTYNTQEEYPITDLGYYQTETIDKVAAFKYKSLELFRKFISIFHCLPTYTELDDMPKGWRKLFGISMCKEIKKDLIEHNYLYDYRIEQIKEKWGGLRWYDACIPNGSKIHEIINAYEDLSYCTCIDCGKPAKYMTTGWICPYCEDCIENENHLGEKLKKYTTENKYYNEEIYNYFINNKVAKRNNGESD